MWVGVFLGQDAPLKVAVSQTSQFFVIVTHTFIDIISPRATHPFMFPWAVESSPLQFLALA